ncbi:shikimate dehydrogenase [Kutzneria sp. CA-103260]|uniref:shikimate dehydrogenase n=1 Tax=Kutzneria sp. CA-103260 TaxID=2802641 RepID=UPI001BAD28D3|nr:shikimate dehydrogenase [Kutzneria sp. CA-103260]QUQ66805.1 shikimate 5-dehydrogenase [Kutzneria sp. CA-103260]
MAARQAAVLGSPIEHSLSPVLHAAAYRELGLSDWTFSRVRCEADELPGFVDGLGPEWAGLAVTMPGKRAALAHAVERTRVAELVGAANTLVPRAAGGWLADCTDVEGIVGSLRAAGGVQGGRAVVLGAGGTATAALTALEALEIPSATIVVRDPLRAGEALACAERVGIDVELVRWDAVDFATLCGGAELVVSTVPVGAVEPVAGDIVRAGCVFDVIYHPWPTPLAQAAGERGTRLVTGLDMLLHQAFAQVQWFTGQPAPRAAMRLALRSATGNHLPLPV